MKLWTTRWQVGAYLVSSLIMLVVVGRAVIQYLNQRTQRREAFYTSSCANHFIQLRLGIVVAASDHPNLILPSTEDFQRAAMSFGTNYFGALQGYGSACPESYLRDQSIGYLYVGDGLRLGDVSEKDILILFCPGENHRGSSEHCHGYSLNRSTMCAGSNGVMIAELERAIARGESGEVAYSERAMKVLRSELEKRRTPIK